MAGGWRRPRVAGAVVTVHGERNDFGERHAGRRGEIGRGPVGHGERDNLGELGARGRILRLLDGPTAAAGNLAAKIVQTVTCASMGGVHAPTLRHRVGHPLGYLIKPLANRRSGAVFFSNLPARPDFF